MTHTAANVINDAFRLYDDDVSGAITAQTALAAVDTNWTQEVDTKFHVAMLATETAGGSANNNNFRLEYNLNSGGWNDVTTTTPIQAVAPTNCTTADAASYGTTALTTGATIQSTEYDTGAGDSAPVTLSNSSFEYTSSLQIDSAQVADTDTLQLRLTDAGTALDADTTIPTITVSESTPTTVTLASQAVVVAEGILTVNQVMPTTVTLVSQALTVTEGTLSIFAEQESRVTLVPQALVVVEGTLSIFAEQETSVTLDPQALIITPGTLGIIAENESRIALVPQSLTVTEGTLDVSAQSVITLQSQVLTITEGALGIIQGADVTVTLDPQSLIVSEGTLGIIAENESRVTLIPQGIALSEGTLGIVVSSGTDITLSSQAIIITPGTLSITAAASFGNYFQKLRQLGYVGTIDDMQKAYLKDQGYPQSMMDAMSLYLALLGYTGALNDKLRQKATAEGWGSVPTMLQQQGLIPV